MIKPLLLVFLVSGCAGLPAFPAKTLKEVDLENKVCVRYKITEAESFKFTEDATLPLEECQSIFGFDAKDIRPVIVWAEKAKKRLKDLEKKAASCN